MSCVEYLRRQLHHCNGNGRKPEHSPKPYTPTFGTRDAGFLIFFLFLSVGKKWGVFYSATAIAKKKHGNANIVFQTFLRFVLNEKKNPHDTSGWQASFGTGAY